MSKKFIEHRPAYFTGFENKTYNVDNFEQVLEIPFVKFFSDSPGFFSFALSVETNPNYKLMLMALYDWDEEYNGCKRWVVVGHLPGFVMYETKLKNYIDFIAGHKPNCWTRKYVGSKDLLGIDRPNESKLKILKELGWHRDDFFGIVNHCDCGFK